MPALLELIPSFTVNGNAANSASTQGDEQTFMLTATNVNEEVLRKILASYEGTTQYINQMTSSINPPEEIYLSPDVEWVVSGAYDDPIVGTYKGIKEVAKLFDMFNNIIAGQRYATIEFISQGDRVVATGEEEIRYRASDRVVSCSFVYVVTFSEGKITKFHTWYGYN